MMYLEYAQYAVTAFLLFATVLEMKTGRIPNWLIFVAPAIFAVLIIAQGDYGAAIWPIGQAIGIFILGLLLFAVGGIGAGAVKLMAVSALFVSRDDAFYALLLFLAAFFTWAVIIVLIRKAVGSEDSNWHVMAKAVIPMSVPISIATLASFYLF